MAPSVAFEVRWLSYYNGVNFFISGEDVINLMYSSSLCTRVCSLCNDIEEDIFLEGKIANGNGDTIRVFCEWNVYYDTYLGLSKNSIYCYIQLPLVSAAVDKRITRLS